MMMGQLFSIIDLKLEQSLAIYLLRVIDSVKPIVGGNRDRWFRPKIDDLLVGGQLDGPPDLVLCYNGQIGAHEPDQDQDAGKQDDQYTTRIAGHGCFC